MVSAHLLGKCLRGAIHALLGHCGQVLAPVDRFPSVCVWGVVFAPS